MNGEAASKPPTQATDTNPVVVWGVVIALGVGALWVYQRRDERESQRQREIMREAHWVVTPNGVQAYKTQPNQNVHQRMKEINDRYSRPIWEDVPESRSGKGKIIVYP